ncbi:hypothetical protein HYI36_05085 [Bacillus sp. Gen3]|nr:hypothetical protein [Bacillus sp. Gen3]
MCDDPVFEDEWSGAGFERYGKFIHQGKCLAEYTLQTKERQIIRKQKKEIEELKADIEELRSEIDRLVPQVKGW